MEDLILEPKRSDDDYFYYDWPVIGDVAIPKATIEKYKDNPSQINRGVVEAYAEWLTDKDIDLSSLDAFTDTFLREVTSSLRGGYEMVSDDRTSSYEEDLVNELYSTMNSGAWWSGLITGALADPVTLPAAVLKAFKLGAIGSGVAVGGFGGFMQPDRPEWGTSQLGNVGSGMLAGGILSGIVSLIAKRVGAKSPEDLQRMFDEGGEEIREIIQKESKDMAEEVLGESANQINQRQAAQDFQDNLAAQSAKTDEMLARQYAEDYNANLARIQGEERQRLANEFNANLQRIQEEGRSRTLLNNAIAQGQENRANAIALQDLQKELQDSIRANTNAGNVADAQKVVTNLQRRLDTNRRQLTAIRDGKKLNVNEDTLLSRRVFFNENLEKAQAKLDAAKALRDDRKKLAQLKAGKETPELKARVSEELAKMERREARPVPEVRPPEPPRNIQSVAERQLPEVPRPPQMIQGEQQAFPAPAQGPVPMRPPVQQPVQAPTAQAIPAQAPQPSAIAGVLGAKSTGAAQVNPLAMPSGAAQAATMNTRTKAAQALPPTTRTTSVDGERVPLDAHLSNAERTRLNSVREDSEVLRDLMSVDGFGTGKYNFDSMVANAETVSDAVLEGINEGNYRSAAEWLATRMMDGDSIRILTPAEKVFAARVRAIAEIRLADMQSVQRQLVRDGAYNSRSISILNDMQLDKELHDAMDEIANVITMTEIDARNTGQALKSLGKANKHYREMRQKIARDSFIDQLFYGVKC